jgi:hypothetical protein
MQNLKSLLSVNINLSLTINIRIAVRRTMWVFYVCNIGIVKLLLLIELWIVNVVVEPL